MTLIIALRCVDGVILSCDSQETEGTGNVKGTLDKVFELTEHAVWGASGVVQICSELRRQFRGFKDEHPEFMSQSLQEKMHPVLTRHYGNYIANVPGQPPSTPGTTVLACGMSPDHGAWITEVDAHCQYTQYERKGYHAIGSGAEAAQYAISVLSHFSVIENSLEYGKVVACRVMDTIIETAAYHLGQPLRIWTVDSRGPQLLDEPEMNKLRQAVESWKVLEKEALLKVLSGKPSVPAGDDISPPPEYT